MKKIMIIGAVLVVVAVAALIFYLLSNLNTLVAAAIEKNGSEVTDTSVRVSEVDIALREGRGSIRGLRVASPEGFRASDAFELGDITVDIDVASVRDDPIVIDEIRIQMPVVKAEVAKNGTSNIDELRKQVQAHSTGSAQGTQGDQKNLRIKRFLFEKGRIELDATALGVERQTVDLPEIRLTDVGGANGAPPDEIAKIVLTAVAKQVASEIARSEANRLIQDQLGESLSDKAGGLLKKLGD
jgi:hypothetical protein